MKRKHSVEDARRVLPPCIPRRCSSSQRRDDSAPAGGPLLGVTRRVALLLLETEYLPLAEVMP